MSSSSRMETHSWITPRASTFSVASLHLLENYGLADVMLWGSWLQVSGISPPGYEHHLG